MGSLHMWFSPWLVLSICAIAKSATDNAKYCIVGAGPAGLQLGQLFKQAGLDYATFERGDHAGMFFKYYPIGRELISVNQRITRSSSKEFNLRHDGNSLLHTGLPPFTESTEEYYPHADTMVEYLRSVATEQRGNIFYNYKVTDISRSTGPDVSGGFDVLIDDLSGKNSEKAKQIRWQCGVVIAAVGLWKPHVPKDNNWFRGLDLALGYEELSPFDGPSFEKLTVLILGNGQAAFDTADTMRDWVAEIGIFGRRPERTSADTHYVGDVREHRMTSFDSLELKTLDDVFFSPEEIASKMELLPCESPGPYRGLAGQGWPQGSAEDRELRGYKGRKPVCILNDYNEEEFLIADNDLENEDVVEALKKFPGIKRRRPLPEHTDWHKAAVANYGDALLEAAGITDVFNNTVLTMSKTMVRELAATSADFRKALPGLQATTSGLWLGHSYFRKPVDVVVRTLGWRVESEPFQSLGVQFDADNKYPLLDACYLAQHKGGGNLDGMYFAGTITHGFDQERFGSPGGFIQGFRYTTESLFHCLMHKFEGRPLWEGSRHVFSWNLEGSCTNKEDGHQVCQDSSQSFVSSASSKQSSGRQSPAEIRAQLEQTPHWSHLMQRANEASGPYVMSCGALLDGIVYNKTARTATYIENMPLDTFESNFIDSPRLVLQFRYGQGAKHVPLEEEMGSDSAIRSGMLAWASKRVHPVFMFAQPSVGLINSTRLHLVEDRWTDFAGRSEVLASFKFLRTVEAAAWSGSKLPTFHEKFDKLTLDCSHHTDTSHELTKDHE